jgi:hypothetical protein
MWLTSESEDEYVVRGVPVLLWAGGGATLGLGIYILLSVGPGMLRLFKPVEEPSNSLTVLVSMSFIPLVGLGILFFAPLIVTRFKPNERIVQYTKYGLLGRDRQDIPYEQLHGGVHVSAEESDEDGYFYVYSAYFELKGGRLLKMCAGPGQSRRQTYTIGMKANEFLRRKVGE